ncbi:MAG TPA: hypothetical protein VFO85_13805, partial [Vicinamibacteria bacterium]|nr:hypothetical protein [Vicinamibacteria bacterium]
GVGSSLDWLQWQGLNRQYWADAVRSLRLPLWNPHVGLGRPFLADVETASLYPGTLPFLLGMRAGLAVSLFLHGALAALGMRLLAAALGAGVRTSAVMAFSYVFMGPLGGRLLVGQIGFAQAACYLPLCVYLALRLQDAPSVRTAALLALALGVQVLAGHPQMAWVTWLGLALFLAGRRLHQPSLGALRRLASEAALLALCIAWALALAAAVLLPYAELLLRSNRGESSLAFAASFALPPAALHTLLVWPERSIYAGLGGWENELYANALMVVAGLAGAAVVRRREATGFLVLLLASLVLCVGERTPAFALAYHLVPGLSLFRLASRIGTLAPFALIGLAGLYLTQPGSPRSRRAALMVALAITAGLLLWVPWSARLEVGAGWLCARIALCAAAGVAVVLHDRLGPSSTAAGLALATVVLADTALAVHTRRAVTAQLAAGAIPPGEAVLAEVLRLPALRTAGGAPPRVLAPLGVARYNAGMALGYSTPAGYVGVAPERVWTFVHEAIGLEPPLHNTGPSPAIFRQPFPYDSMSLAVGFDPQAQRLVVATAPDARAYLAPCAQRVPTWREATRRIAAGHDLHRCALLEGGEAAPAPLAGGKAEVVAFAPERVTVAMDAAGPGLLVLGEAWYPGWEARIDGRGAEA